MENKTRNKILIITLIIIAAGAYFFYSSNFQDQSEELARGTEIGMKAPKISLKNINNREINLKDFQGKKVLLNFWASWCPPCKEEMPALQQLESNHGREIIILAINIGETKATAVNFMQENNLNFPVLLDRDKSTAQKYLVRGVPMSYFLDENGIITDKVVGAIDYQKMLKLSDIY